MIFPKPYSTYTLNPKRYTLNPCSAPRMAGGAQTDTSASNEDITGAQISASSATIYVVVYEFKVVGQYDTLAGAKSKLSEYSGHGKNRMAVPAICCKEAQIKSLQHG